MFSIFISFGKLILIFFLLGIAAILLLPIIILLILRFSSTSRRVIFKIWRGFPSTDGPETEFESKPDPAASNPKIIEAEWHESP